MSREGKYVKSAAKLHLKKILPDFLSTDTQLKLLHVYSDWQIL